MPTMSIENDKPDEELKQEDEQEATTAEEQTEEVSEPEEKSEPEQQQDEDISSTEKAMADLGLTDEEETEEKQEEEKPAEEKPEEKQEQKEEPKTEQKEEQKAEKPEGEEAILAAIPSKRGRERIHKLLSDGRQAQQNLNNFYSVIQQSGMDEQSFSTFMEMIRLVNSGDERQVESGLKMLESVRSDLYRNLGREAAGIDFLDNYDDLKKRVDNLDLTRNDAIEIAKARMRQDQERAQAEATRKQQEESNAYRQRVGTFQKQVENAFIARRNEVDFAYRMKAMQDYFAVPENMQRFVQNVPPEQWQQSLMWYYDNVPAQKTPAQRTPTPLSGMQTRKTGVRSRVHANPREDISSLIDEMGL